MFLGPTKNIIFPHFYRMVISSPMHASMVVRELQFMVGRKAKESLNLWELLSNQEIRNKYGLRGACQSSLDSIETMMKNFLNLSTPTNIETLTVNIPFCNEGNFLDQSELYMDNVKTLMVPISKPFSSSEKKEVLCIWLGILKVTCSYYIKNCPKNQRTK